MRILVAEDEAFSRLLLVKTLSQWGFEVQAVADGSEALAILAQPDGPSIAVLDGYLPGENGVTICRRIRELPNLPFRYLLMLTAKADTQHRIRALTEGADAFLAKPFDLAELGAYISVARRQAAFFNDRCSRD